MNWLVGALLILLLAIALQMGLLAFAMYAVILVVLISRYLAKTWIENLEVTRECNRNEAEIGDTIAVVLTIRNTGRWPIAWIMIEDLLPRHLLMYRPPTLKVIGKRILFSMLKAGETTRLMYQIRCNRRGYFQLGPAMLETGDLFGLHRRFKVVTEPEYVLVFPRIQPIERYDIASRRPIGEVRMTYRIFEDPTRNAGVRKYVAGDPLNRVHWAATARTGILHSKLYEPSSVAGGTLLLDFHHDSNPARHEPVRSDLAVTAAASITHALYEMGQQVGLVSNGRDAIDRIQTEGWRLPPRTRQATRESVAMRDVNRRLRPVRVPTARGAETRWNIIKTLARLELTDGMTFPELVVETTPLVPRDATIIAILGAVTERIAIALGNLQRQGFAVSAVVNTFEATDFADQAGLLLAQGVGAHHLADEESIVTICRRLSTSRFH